MSKPNFRLSKRIVSARFWANPELSKLAKQSGIRNLKLTMIGLWAFADESGIFEWQPEIAASMIYPLDTEEDRSAVEPAMSAMVEAGFLKKLEVNGTWYGIWPKWGEHNKFRKNDSRYPEVAAALGYPTPCEGENTPLEDEVRSRSRSGNGIDGLNGIDGISEPDQASTSREQDTETPHGPQDSPPVPRASASEDSAVARLAKKFFKLMGQPCKHIDKAGEWEKIVARLLSEYKEDDLTDLMTFALEENDYSIEYLGRAKDPMATFVKNRHTLAERRDDARRIEAKLAKAAEKKAEKKAAFKKDDNRPEYKKDQTQFL
jgi:hypothetical protein